MLRAAQLWVAVALLLAFGYPSPVNTLAHPVAAAAQPAALDSTSPITARAVDLVGQNGGSIGAVVVAGKYAYLAINYGLSESQSGIVVLDVSDPQAPIPVGRSERLSTHGTALLIVKGYLYMFGTDVSVLNISSPERPVLAAALGVAGAYPLLVGRYLYFASSPYENAAGFHIVDTLKPEQPSLVGWVAIAGASILRSDGRYLYVGQNNDYPSTIKPGLTVFDLANPTRPVSIAKYDMHESPKNFVIYGRYIYLFEALDFGGTYETLHIFDISVPSKPQVIKDINLNRNKYWLRTMAIVGQRLYLGYEVAELWEIYDLTQPTQPALIGTGNGILDTVVGSQIYTLTSDNDRLTVVDIADPKHPRTLGSHRLLHESSSLAIHGEVAYLNRSMADITDPRWPAQKDGTLLGFSDLVEVGNIAYAAGGLLTTFDISDPLRPTKLGELPAGEGMRLQQAAIAGRYAYVDDENLGIRVLDLVDPTKPIQIGSLSITADILSIAVSGNYLYLSTGNDGPILSVVDVSNPAQPALVRSITVPHDNRPDMPLAIVGNRLYLASDRLRVFDLTNPATPTLLGSLNQPDKANDIVVANGYAYIVGEPQADHPNGGLWVVNVANPAQPVLARVVDMNVYDGRLARDGNRLYVRADLANTLIFTLGAPANPQRIAIVPTSSAYDIIAQGNSLFVLANSEGEGPSVQTVDLTNLAQPRVVSDIPLPFGLAWDLQGQGNLLYAAVEQSLRVIDRTDPRQLKEIGAYFHVFGTGGIAVAGHYAYLTAGDLGLHTVDIADPWHPRPVGYNYRLGDTSSIAIAGTYAYVTTLRSDFGRFVGLLVVDISDPANPVEVASLTLLDAYIGVGSVLDILIQGQYAYVAASAGGIQVVDISTPTHPLIVAKQAASAANKLALANDYLFVADQMGGLRVIDIASPAHPVEVGAYVTGNSIADVAAANGLIYTAGEDGLMVLRFLGTRLSPTVGWSLVYTDTQGLATTLDVPVGAVAQPLTLVFNPVATVSPPDGRALAGHAFDLTAYRNGAAVPRLAFAKPISATVAYADNDLAVLSDKAAIQLLGWDSGAWQDAASSCGGQQTHDRVRKLIRSPICRASSYGLFGPTHQARLPLARR